MTLALSLQQDTMNWLKNRVFPLWSTTGFDSKAGTFIESLNFEGQALSTPLRALVLARQIYSFAEGVRLQAIEKSSALKLIEQSTDYFIKNYSLPNGAFVHSVDKNGHVNKDTDLYSQAFAIFALAHAYEFIPKAEYKTAALKLVSYLHAERRNPAGGYTEIKGGKVLFQSNPHMHLFEAALAWAKIDLDSTWKKLAQELHDLCRSQFIDAKTHFLAEHFNEKWESIKEDGQFIFEPGHHFEWSWLFYQYQQMTGTDCSAVSESLFKTAEQYGLSAHGELAYDEIWSNGTPHKKSSRFWPQTERIKAAVVLKKFDSADKAMKALIQHYLVMDKGLWRDTRLENGSYADIPVKASSLYHIINAISEYKNHRM